MKLWIIRTERTEHFICGNVQEAKSVALRSIQSLPILPRGMEQSVSPDDIGLDKRLRAVNRPVDMRLGGQVHDAIRSRFGETSADCVDVANVGLNKRKTIAVIKVSERLAIAGIRQFVNRDDLMTARPDQVPGQIAANKSRGTCDKNFQDFTKSRSSISRMRLDAWPSP